MNVKTRRELLSEAIDGDPNDAIDGTAETPSEGLESSQTNEGQSDESSQVSTNDQKLEGTTEDKNKIQWSGDKGKKVDPYAKERKDAAKPGAEIAKKPGEEDQSQQSSEIRAPNSWKPAEREHWAKMPKEAQQAVQRRELEIQRSLSETATTRRWANDFAQVIAPHSHLIRAQNSTPLQAIDNLMRTSASLTTLRGRDQASIVAQICRNFNVDIRELDNCLSEMQSQGGNQQNNGGGQIPPEFAQALRPINDFMARIEGSVQQREQQVQSNAQQSAENFLSDPKNEFAEDLADDMADILELSAKRGKKVTIQQAYQQAIRNNPDIEAIVAQRAAAARNQGAPRARRAALSIQGSPQGAHVGAKPPTGSRREALLAAYDDAKG